MVLGWYWGGTGVVLGWSRVHQAHRPSAYSLYFVPIQIEITSLSPIMAGVKLQPPFTILSTLTHLSPGGSEVNVVSLNMIGTSRTEHDCATAVRMVAAAAAVSLSAYEHAWYFQWG